MTVKYTDHSLILLEVVKHLLKPLWGAHAVNLRETKRDTVVCFSLPQLWTSLVPEAGACHRPRTNASCSSSHFPQTSLPGKNQIHKPKQIPIIIVRRVEVLSLCLSFPLVLQSLTKSPCHSCKYLFLSWHRFTQEGKEVNARDLFTLFSTAWETIGPDTSVVPLCVLCHLLHIFFSTCSSITAQA